MLHTMFLDEEQHSRPSSRSAWDSELPRSCAYVDRDRTGISYHRDTYRQGEGKIIQFKYIYAIRKFV